MQNICDRLVIKATFVGPNRCSAIFMNENPNTTTKCAKVTKA